MRCTALRAKLSGLQYAISQASTQLPPTVLSNHSAINAPPPAAYPCSLKKVLVDQLTYGPLQNVLFMTFLAYMVEGRSGTATRCATAVGCSGWGKSRGGHGGGAQQGGYQVQRGEEHVLGCMDQAGAHAHFCCTALSTAACSPPLPSPWLSAWSSHCPACP